MSATDRVRTFLAVYPDRETHERVVDLLSGLRRRVPGVRWSPDHQLHFTLRFFGDLDVRERDAATGALEAACPVLAPVSFPLCGLGAFPDWKRPRVLWVGAGAGGEELEEVARRLDLAFREAGLGRADKPFRSHLTLGRVREGERPAPELLEELKRAPFTTPPCRMSEVRLMASRLSPQGAEHSVIRSFPLGATAPPAPRR